jgi:hypothetical protein
MQCNIDAVGKRLRLISGLIVLAAAVVLATVAAAFGGWWWWALTCAALACGAFQVFEARKGWCALRAMGIKTPV